MASHRAVAAALLIASLVMAVALSKADARPTVRPDKTAAALSGADVRRTGGDTKLTEPELHDPPRGPGFEAAAPKPDDELVKPNCDGDGDGDGDGDEEQQLKDHPEDHSKDNLKDNNSKDPNDPGHLQQLGESPNPQPRDPGTDSEESELDQELCTTCEEPKKTEPPCNTCQPKEELELTCNNVHAVQEGETCYSLGQCAGLGQDDFLRFNPNLCCENLFVGQWVCLDATCAA